MSYIGTRKCTFIISIMTLLLSSPFAIPLHSGFVEEKMGAKYVENRQVEFAKSYEESGPGTPIFFILSPGVDPLKDVEALGKKLGFTFDNKNFHNVSLGQVRRSLHCCHLLSYSANQIQNQKQARLNHVRLAAHCCHLLYLLSQSNTKSKTSTT